MLKLLVLAGLLLALPAAAPQNPAGPPTSVPGGAEGSRDDQALSSRLAESNGTIHPPAVDRGIVEHPAEKGTMPVIPPPGTPHGAPGPVPK